MAPLSISEMSFTQLTQVIKEKEVQLSTIKGEVFEAREMLKVRLEDLVTEIDSILMDCLFNNQAEADSFIGVQSNGIRINVRFHPMRLASHREKILQIMNEIVPDAFFLESGGGMSFLNLCIDEKGKQWGEQDSAEQLFLLAQAIGHAGKNTSHPAIITALPGGMPFVWFSKKEISK